MSSTQSRPSIPRRETAQIFSQSQLGLSQLVVKIEWGVAYLEKVQGNAVKAPKAELDLAEYFDTARFWLEQLVQKKDKSMMRSIFEGDGVGLLAHLEGLCYRVELKVSNDKRRLDLVQRIAACNDVLLDLGYAELLRQAKLSELGALNEEEETQENPVEDAIPHLVDAAFLGSQAMAYEQVCDYAGAAEAYGKATRSLRVAITVCRAVAQLKASIGKPHSSLQDDLMQLQRLESQTSMRQEHLENLEPGAAPIGIAEQIDPVELSIHQDFKFAKKAMHKYAGLWGVVAAVGVGGILYMSGPFGFALLAGAAVGTAVTVAFSRHDAGESGQEMLKEVLASSMGPANADDAV